MWEPLGRGTPAKGHLDICDIILGPYTIIHVKMSLLSSVEHLVNSPQCRARPNDCVGP